MADQDKTVQPPEPRHGAAANDRMQDARPSSPFARSEDVNDNPGLRWPWLLSDRGIFTAGSAVTAIGIIGLTIMLVIADSARGGERANLQIEAIKYGLGFFAAGGAAVALLLSVRRQQLSEYAHRLELRKQKHSESDAEDRRITELYTKAAEQLGASDAAVRLAGLYALERLAQRHTSQRQTIVNLLCAYLRMPYNLPLKPAKEGGAADDSINVISESPLASDSSAIPGSRDPDQELQVRLTAQRILISHLQASDEDDAHPNYAARVIPAEFWPDIDIDLSGAVLRDWYLRFAVVRNANFSNARFHGVASFYRTTFSGQAVFENARFIDSVSFGDVLFESTQPFGTSFYAAQFFGNTSFGGARFAGNAWFDKTFASEEIGFSKARFCGVARFYDAVFAKNGRFSLAKFDNSARFDGSDFRASAYFDRSIFVKEASFHSVRFNGRTTFREAEFRNKPNFDRCVVASEEASLDGWPQELRNIVESGKSGA